MKKFLAIAIVLSVLSFGAFAQDGTKKVDDEKKSYVRKEYVNKKMVRLSPEQMAEKRTEKLAKDLNLTAKQREDVHKLHLDQANTFKKKQEIRKKEREEERKERLAQREKFESLLTPEQKAIWKEKMAKRSERMDGKDKGERKEFHKRDKSRKTDRRVG